MVASTEAIAFLGHPDGNWTANGAIGIVLSLDQIANAIAGSNRMANQAEVSTKASDARFVA